MSVEEIKSEITRVVGKMEMFEIGSKQYQVYHEVLKDLEAKLPKKEAPKVCVACEG